MNISLNDILRVDGEEYRVIGMITYRNTADYKCWDEYRLMPTGVGREKWLSIDEGYDEYSISEMTNSRSMPGYHEVDRGTAVVVSARGNVDVDPGERMNFTEYEDSTEELTFSVETWSDGSEYSTGYYLDRDEIVPVGNSSGGYSSNYSSSFVSGNTYRPGNSGRAAKGVVTVFIMIICFFPMLLGFIGSSGTKKIADYLKSSAAFSYVTSTTGRENQKADVYKSTYDLDTTAKVIIDAVNGKTEQVKQNTDDGDTSIGILTKKEYCLIYISEDGDVLVQVSSREYAYYSDNQPYRSTSHTHRYYRRFYRYSGYTTDSGKYKNSSPYDSYSGSDSIDWTSSDAYRTYSGSVRQASTSSRTSSGGGTSSGK